MQIAGIVQLHIISLNLRLAESFNCRMQRPETLDTVIYIYIVTTSKALVTTSKALVTTSDAPVTSSLLYISCRFRQILSPKISRPVGHLGGQRL